MDTKELPELPDLKAWLQKQSRHVQVRCFGRAKLSTLQSEALLGQPDVPWDKPAPLAYMQQIVLLDEARKHGYVGTLSDKSSVNAVVEADRRELEIPGFLEHVELQAATELAKQLLKQGLVTREVREEFNSPDVYYSRVLFRFTLNL